MIDVRVVTAECTFQFHKLRMAEYRTGRDGAPTFQLRAFPAVDQADQTGSDRPPTFERPVQAATRTTAANQAESEKITLYSSSSEIDYELLTAGFCRLTDARFLLRCWGVFVR